jgi:cytochrome c5
MKIMPTNKFAAWLAAATVCLAGSLAGGIAAAANAPAVSQKLDNATCQTCHDGKKGKLEVPKAERRKARAARSQYG